MLSDQELSVPTSTAARSWTLSFQVPAAVWPLKFVIAWLVMMMLSAAPPARLETTNCVPPGEISVTTRSPRNVCVMLSDSVSEATVPLPVTRLFDVMPVALLSGIVSGRSVAANAPLMHVPPALETVNITVDELVAPWLSVAVAVIVLPAPLATRVVSNVVENGAVVSVTLVPSGRSNRTLATVPSESAAVAATVIVPLTVEPAVGDVIETVGAWLLLVIVTDALALCVADVPVPVTVKLAVVAPVDAGTVTVKVELPPAVTLVGLND